MLKLIKIKKIYRNKLKIKINNYNKDLVFKYIKIKINKKINRKNQKI